MSEKRKNIDDIFRDKLQGFEAPVPDRVWENINKELKRKKRFPILWWLSSILALSVAGAVYFNFYLNEERIKEQQAAVKDERAAELKNASVAPDSLKRTNENREHSLAPVDAEPGSEDNSDPVKVNNQDSKNVKRPVQENKEDGGHSALRDKPAGKTKADSKLASAEESAQPEDKSSGTNEKVAVNENSNSKENKQDDEQPANSLPLNDDDKQKAEENTANSVVNSSDDVAEIKKEETKTPALSGKITGEEAEARPPAKQAAGAEEDNTLFSESTSQKNTTGNEENASSAEVLTDSLNKTDSLDKVPIALSIDSLLADTTISSSLKDSLAQNTPDTTKTKKRFFAELQGGVLFSDAVFKAGDNALEEHRNKYSAPAAGYDFAVHFGMFIKDKWGLLSGISFETLNEKYAYNYTTSTFDTTYSGSYDYSGTYNYSGQYEYFGQYNYNGYWDVVQIDTNVWDSTFIITDSTYVITDSTYTITDSSYVVTDSTYNINDTTVSRTDSSKSHNSAGRYRLIGIPLIVHYRVKLSEKFDLSLNGGVIFYHLWRARSSWVDPKTNEIISHQQSSYNNFLFALRIAPAISYKINESWMLALQPGYTSHLRSLFKKEHNIILKPQVLTGNIAIRYNF